MSAWNQGPIYEPKDSRYRPSSVGTLIFFFIGRFFGLIFTGFISLMRAILRRPRRK